MYSQLFQESFDPTITNPYLLLGYVVMWLIAAIYVLSLVIRQRNLRRDIELMKRLLEDDQEESHE